MKPFLTTIFSLFFICLSSVFIHLSAQSTDYWQQRCDYEIQATLDDTKHTLDAYLKLQYQNNSPDTLTYIYFHLWPNAFKNTETAFAKQKIEDGSLKFYYALPSELGFIEKLAFKVDGKEVKLELDDKNIDIGKIILAEPLLPNQSINIETPFSVQIPNSYSRLGHVGQSYQITQWYPKPAVYDKDGWHQMPYLDQGEFYSEYGSFDVKITLPDNYVVGATGDLQNEEEFDFLDEKVAETEAIKEFGTDNDFPASSADFKTLHYKQDNIHDFAWFADKRFHVLKEEFNLVNTDRTVTAWAMFTNKEAELWTKATDYLVGATQHYSEKVGTYPYNQVTAVQSALSAGAGMEYPTITVIGVSGNDRSLETVIVHEVGHNWFYGQLGSNERKHPWMDEGINSYYEQRYFTAKYPDADMTAIMGGLPDFLSNGLGLEGKKVRDGYELIYQFLARSHADQPICTHSKDFTSTNYGAIAYTKSVLAFDYLEAYLGQKELDRVMQEYYRQFEFKHPQPEDIRAVFESEISRPIDWFFDEMIGTKKPVDYWLHKLLKKGTTIGKDTFDVVLVRNHPRNVQGPYSITAVKDDKPLHTIWYDGFHYQEEVLFPTMEYDALVMDYHREMPEYDRKNNFIKPKGLFKKSSGFNVGLLPKVESNHGKQLFVTPIIGTNIYDRVMLGVAIYNELLPSRNLSFTLAPMYALGSQKPVGTAEINYNWYPDKESSFLKRIGFNLHGKSFSYNNYTISANEKEPFSYYRVVPKVTFELSNKSPRSKVIKEITLRHIHLWSDQVDDGNTFPFKNYFEEDYFNEIAFNYRNKRVLRPYDFKVAFQQGPDLLLGTGEVNYSFVFNKDKRAFSIRAFAGYYFDNKIIGEDGDFANPKYLPMAGEGAYDATYDQLYFGRNESDGLASRQIYNTGGGFKIANFRGRSQEWLAAVNLETSIPFIPKIPFKLFADIGVSADEANLYSEDIGFLYDAGVSFSILNGIFNIYAPLLYPDVYNVDGKKWYDRVTFMIKIDKLNPIRAVREFRL